MKKLIVYALLVFAGLCSANRDSAQDRQLQGRIPFNFTAGSARLSAGEYRITYDLSGLVTFHNLEKGASAMTFVGADQDTKNGPCVLVFSRYGEQYFLKQSRCSAGHASFFVPTSALERKAVEQAAVTNDDGQTVVAMK